MARESKKEIILKTAVEHFSLYGYESTSLENIAQECNITKPAIYYHFKDKASLYETVTCSQLLKLANLIEKQTIDGDASRRLYDYIQTFGSFLISNPAFNAIFAREIANGAKTLSLECSSYLSKTLFRLMEILEDGEKQGIFEKENPFMIQMMIVTTLTSYNTTKPLREKIIFVLENKHKLPDVEFENVVDSLAKKIIKGLLCSK